MPIEITMPRLSDTMERGTIVHWGVKEGDTVAPGQVIGDIETDKATMELQSFDAGTVAAIICPEGQAVDVGKPILVLAEKNEDVAAVKARYATTQAVSAGSSANRAVAQKVGSRAEPVPAQAPPARDTGSAVVAVVDAGEPVRAGDGRARDENGVKVAHGIGGRVFASPLAKKVAQERGVDLHAIQGSGPGGRIVKRDVEGAAAGVTTPALRPAAGPRQAQPSFAAGALTDQVMLLSNMRRTIAQRLVHSKTTIPHYQVTMSVAMDKLLELRKQLNQQLESQGVKLSVNDFIVRACALAMLDHPHINASWGDDGASVRLHGAVNIGVAIALPIEKGGGLVVATIRDADRIGLRSISAQTKSLSEKARTRGLTIEEMADSTFTISNLGMYGVDHFTAIINPPNSAILAVGAAVEKPVVREGQIVVGHEMQMTMSSDHRVIDGAMAAGYLASVKAMLEAPATLLI